jgi:hypothetical protein
MKDSELDAVYTQLCRTMTDLGVDNAPLYLARFALLAIQRIDDPEAAMRLVAEAADGMAGRIPEHGSPGLKLSPA